VERTTAVAAATTSRDPPAPTKHPGGRATVLTDELQHKIVSFIRAGGWDWVAAEANGIDRQRFWEWIRRGEGTEHTDRPQTKRYAKFAKEVREARAQSRARAEIRVQEAGPVKYLGRFMVAAAAAAGAPQRHRRFCSTCY
jgi:hypothetical protein